MSIPRNLSFLAQGASSTGVLSVSYGGTGATTLTANNVLLGNGTSAFQVVAPGTNGNILTSNGTTWTSAAAPAGSAWTTIKKTTDQVLSTVGTYVNDDQLQFSVAANSTYAMRGAYLLPSSSRFACNGPSATLNFSVPYTNGTATTAYNSGFAVPGGTSFLYLFSINLVVGGSSGTFAMRLYNTTISTPITFLKGSYIEYMKVT